MYPTQSAYIDLESGRALGGKRDVVVVFLHRDDTTLCRGECAARFQNMSHLATRVANVVWVGAILDISATEFGSREFSLADTDSSSRDSKCESRVQLDTYSLA